MRTLDFFALLRLFVCMCLTVGSVGRVSERQKIAEYTFRSEGIILNFSKEN